MLRTLKLHGEIEDKICLYKIVNINNNFVYIGVTKNPKARWWKHKYCAKRQDKRRLYKDMRTFGLDGFKLIEISWHNKSEVLKIETELILSMGLENLYNSYSGGNLGGIESTVKNASDYRKYYEIWKTKGVLYLQKIVHTKELSGLIVLRKLIKEKEFGNKLMLKELSKELIIAKRNEK